MFWSLPFTIAAVFAFVALVTGVLVSMALAYTSAGQQRLRHIASPAGAVVEGSLVSEWSPGSAAFRGLVRQSPQRLGKLRKRLARAGYQSVSAAAFYASAEVVLPIAFGLATLLLLGARVGLVIALIAATVGYFVPGLVLERATRTRQKAISDGLPDVLDLLIVCLEAGLGMDQAIVKVSDELAVAHPALTEELKTLTVEMRAGKPRLEAFRNLAARTGVEDVRSLVAMLAQTDKFGTSVSQALRTHAEVSRTKRRQRAEERAAKVGVKLVFPLVFCLFPAFYVVTLGPAVIQFVRVFYGQVVHP